MSNPKSFYKLIIISLSLLIVVVVIASYPAFIALNSLSKKVSEKETILASFTAKEQTLNSLEKSYNNVKKDSDKIFLALPEEKDSANLMASLENLAKIKGIESTIYLLKEPIKKKQQTDKVDTDTKSNETGKTDLVALEFLQTEKKEDVYRLQTVLTLTGSYSKILEYVKEYEKLNRLLITEKVTITKEKLDGAPGDYAKAIIEFSVYLKK